MPKVCCPDEEDMKEFEEAEITNVTSVVDYFDLRDGKILQNIYIKCLSP